MKKHIKLFVFITSILSVFLIYNLFINKQNKITYIALGDSIAEGMTPYHSIDYGYTDYIGDYLKKNNKLSFYTKQFSKSGYTTGDLKNDINNNKLIEIDGKRYYLKEILRESSLVTLTIGANDFIKGMSIQEIPTKLLNMSKVKKEVDKIASSVKDLLILVKKYAKKDIIVTGYFNPLPRLKEFKSDLDEIIKYYNNLIEEICIELNITYVDIFDILEQNNEVFSNPIDIHPNKKGYELISKEIIKKLE